MTKRVPINVQLDSFEGPLDLLLYLIQTHELDISKVSISRVTHQYLNYIRMMQELNFEMASDFLVMAATLLLWKSRALLPKDGEEKPEGESEEEALTPDDLIRQLMEHQRFLLAGDELARVPRLYQDVFTRPNEKPPVVRVWREMNCSDLALSYQDILVRASRRKTVLKKETVSVAEKIQQMSHSLEIGKLIPLDRLWIEPSRGEMVVSFLASLELARLKKMKVHQQEAYQTIYLELLEIIDELTLSLQSEFDSTTPQPAVQG